MPKQKNNDKPPSDKAQFIVVTDRKFYLKSIVHQIGFSVNYNRKDFLCMNIENFFDINSYSETNMPFASELFTKLNESYFLQKSNDLKSVERKITLTDEEDKLFEKVYSEYLEQSYIQQREWFNIGFRLGANFALEVCGR